MLDILHTNFLCPFFFCGGLCVGADVSETEAGGGEREASGRARALQEVFDAAADSLAPRRPLQRLPPQVTPHAHLMASRLRPPFRLTPRVYFHGLVGNTTGSEDEWMNE